MRDPYQVFLALVCLLIIVGPLVLVGFLFLSTMARAASKVSPENRRLEPSQVWLNLIPMFNLVWCSISVDRLAESLRNEYVSRGLDQPQNSYGRSSGLTCLVLTVIGFFLLLAATSDFTLLPGFVMSLLAGLFGIVYWVQLTGYARGLRAGAYRPPPIDEEW